MRWTQTVFLTSVLFDKTDIDPLDFCHLPVIVDDSETLLGEAILQLKVKPERSGNDVIDKDVILFWGDQKRVITGADILGRLLKGIVIKK